MYEKWLKAFHMVASQSSFTHAAKALNVGQPTISAHIKTLEDYFKVELFYRRGRTVELTDVGRSLFTITQGLYGHEAEAISYLRSIGRNDGGRLRLGAVGPARTSWRSPRLFDSAIRALNCR
jgi:DNA-binding transcriptional LysR family regulator